MCVFCGYPLLARAEFVPLNVVRKNDSGFELAIKKPPEASWKRRHTWLSSKHPVNQIKLIE